jgi:hypothetical protein
MMYAASQCAQMAQPVRAQSVVDENMSDTALTGLSRQFPVSIVYAQPPLLQALMAMMQSGHWRVCWPVGLHFWALSNTEAVKRHPWMVPI